MELPNKGYEGYNYYDGGSPVFCTQYVLEFGALLAIYKTLKPKKVLEIGTHYGGTLWHWLDSGVSDCIVTAVDDHHINAKLYNDWLRDEQKVVEVRGKSQDDGVMNTVRDGQPYNWIFIDGGHTFPEVMSDWHLALDVADKNALVVFHDILPYKNTEADKVWALIKHEGYDTMELIENYEQDGCGLGIVYL